MFRKKPSVPASGGSVLGSTTIAWDDQFKAGNIMWKVPRNIRLNDNIVVREDEIAVFYRDGKVLTYFDQPNRYALTDVNAPLVGKLLKFFTGEVLGGERWLDSLRPRSHSVEMVLAGRRRPPFQ